MPPKSKKETKEAPKEEPKAASDEQIRAADDKLKSDAKPNEADFKIILGGADGGIVERTLAAQLIAVHAPKFPKLMKQASSAVIKLSKDEDYRIKTEAVRHLTKFLEADKNGICNALYHALGDEDPKIQLSAYESLSRLFTEGDDEFRQSFIGALKDQSSTAQAKMVDLIKEKFEFTEENAALLIEVCETAFKSALVSGLQLARSKGSILSEEQKAALAAPLFDRLRSDLKSSTKYANFEAVCTNILIPLLENSKSLDTTYPERLLEVISDEVAPRIGEFLPNGDKQGNMTFLKRLLERCYELHSYVHGDALITNIYSQVFTTLPKNADDGNLDFAIIERTLLALSALARRNAKAFSGLVGKHMVCTGQPGETEGVEENAEKYADYEARLTFIRDQAKEFIKQLGEQKDTVRKDNTLGGDEKAEKLRKLSKGVLAVANAKNCCFVLLGKRPLLDKLPDSPSWYNRRPNQSKPFRNGRNSGPKPKKFGDRREGGRRNDRNDRNRSSRSNNNRRDSGRRK